VRRLKRLWDCPSYLILRDIFPQWAVDAGVMKQGLAWRFFRWVEDRQYAAADVIGVQSPANLDYFRERGWQNKYRLEVLHNWMQVGPIPKTAAETRKAWGLDGRVVFFYGGNIGIAQDVDNLVRLAENLRDTPQACLLLVGEGSEVPRLKADIERRGLTNMLVKPAVGQDEYFRLLAEFDVGLISLSRTLQTQNVPGKLLGYLHHGMPVLASINPGNDLQQLIEDRQAGLVSINGDDALFAQQAKQLVADVTLRRTMGRNGRRLLEDVFSVQQTVRQLLASVGGTETLPQRRAA
jgi:glycosyltransferase involved in cell wall biosynthesis